MRQFLIESSLLSCLGGVLGIGAGIGLTLVGERVLPRFVDDFPPPVLSVQPIVAALVVSMAIGLFAGGYPAFRAARMRPIEALRAD